MEVARLRAEVKDLRSEATDKSREHEETREQLSRLRRTPVPAPATAPRPDFLAAGQTLAEWQRACIEAQRYIYLACFTFDHATVIKELSNARARGLTVRILFSRQDRSKTPNQNSRPLELRGRGVEVRGHRGSRLHARVLITENVVIVGSCNFTRASIANAERGVKLAGLTEAELINERDWFDTLFDAAEPFQGGVGAPVPGTPQR